MTPLLTPKQAAEQLSLSQRTVYNMIEKKTIDHFAFKGSGKRPIYRISQEAVDRIIDKGRTDSDDT